MTLILKLHFTTNLNNPPTPSVRGGFRKENKKGGNRERSRACLPPLWAWVGISPSQEIKTKILVNYLCFHALQGTSEIFPLGKESVYKTLSQM